MVMMHISQYTQKCEHKYCNAALGYNLVIKMVFLEHLYCQILFIDPHNFHTSVCKLIEIPTVQVICEFLVYYVLKAFLKLKQNLNKKMKHILPSFYCYHLGPTD